ncbi:P-loop containing nucleoside triphosphate hydrolase protein [Mycena sanguinolenta]|nr:P-loop containing nucleoside triphosphate hydrolase protein [Mycena sanguinolenta]
MSSTDSPDTSASQPSRKSRWNPFRSRSSKSGPKLASVKSAGDKRSHEAVNIHISGGQGGSGGSGGVHGGGGGTGEGPTLQYNIKAEHFTMHAMNTGSAVNAVHIGSDIVQASQAINHCPPPSQIFQGRQAILDSMHQFFTQDTGKQKRYVLYGLGGAGKTQIALKFIKEWTKSSFTDQLLVDASNTDTIETGLRNIAVTKKAGNSWQDILFWLASRHEEWLLFFDNADDPQINLNQFFPKCGHGNIIITSRNPNLRVYGGHSHVSDMEESDAVALLLKSAQYATSATNETLATEIVKVLCYFPLAIVQAGAFILESEALETYLDLFSKNRTELLKRKPIQMLDDYAWAVYTTWEMSFSKLSAPAVMFLQLCSFLHRADISEEIFARAANYIKKSLNQPQSLSNGEIKPEEFLSYFLGPSGDWDSFEFLKLTNEIKAYSLISYNTERKSFSIHPLVHSWSQTTLYNPDQYQSCIKEILGMSIEEIPEHDMTLASLRLVSHVDSLMQVIPKLTTNFQEQYARTYYYVGQYTKAETLQLSETERCRKCSGDDHPDTLRAMHRLAMTYNILGRDKEAEKLYTTVLAMQKKLLSDGSPQTLYTMHALADTYDNLGQFEEAQKLKIEVLEKRQKLLGDDHLDTLDTMNNLATSYDNLGQFEEAKKLKIEVLEKRRKLLGNDHPDTLQTMHSLAMSYDNLGQFEEAKNLEIEVLEKWRKLLGDDHPDTLDAMNNLAVTHYNLGRFEEAEMLQVVVLEKWRKVLGDDHQYTLKAMQNLALTYDKLGRTEEAKKLRAILSEKGRKQ